MNPLGLLVGGRSMSVFGLILVTGLFSMGSLAGAEAALSPDAAFQETHGAQMEAMDNATATASEGFETPGERLLYESTVKPMLDAATVSLDSGLWFGYAHPWLGKIAGYLSGLGVVAMGVCPFLGGME